MSICAAIKRVLRPRVPMCFYAVVLAIPVIAQAESEDPFVPGNEIRATVDGNPVRGLVAAADEDAVQLVQRSGAKIREFPRAALLDVVVRPAASLGVGASLSILTTDNALESGIVTAIDATGIRLRDDEGLSETELPWERVQAFARVHRAPPAAGIELMLGDEIVLGRTLGGVYRGVVASSDAEVIFLKVAGVDRPIRFEWRSIAAWACGDDSAPLPIGWNPPREPGERPRFDELVAKEAPSGSFVATLELLHGNKTLSESDWGPWATQSELGVRLNGGDRRWPVLVTIDHFQSRYRSDLYGILAETRETAAGVRHNFDDGGTFVPWVEGGAAHLVVRLSSSTASVSGAGIGFWAGAGVTFRVTRFVTGGLSIRHSSGDVSVNEVTLPAGGTHVLLSIGFGVGRE